MEAHERELGPIDIVVIGFPAGSPMTGDAIPLLMDIVERGIIRILDVMFVLKDEQGMFTGFEAKELDDKGVGDFKIFEGASSGHARADSDAETAAGALEPGEGAAVIVYENTWAAAVRRRRAAQRRRRSSAASACRSRTSSRRSKPPKRQTV